MWLHAEDGHVIAARFTGQQALACSQGSRLAQGRNVQVSVTAQDLAHDGPVICLQQLLSLGQLEQQEVPGSSALERAPWAGQHISSSHACTYSCSCNCTCCLGFTSKMTKVTALIIMA